MFICVRLSFFLTNLISSVLSAANRKEKALFKARRRHELELQQKLSKNSSSFHELKTTKTPTKSTKPPTSRAITPSKEESASDTEDDDETMGKYGDKKTVTVSQTEWDKLMADGKKTLLEKNSYFKKCGDLIKQNKALLKENESLTSGQGKTQVELMNERFQLSEQVNVLVKERDELNKRNHDLIQERQNLTKINERLTKNNEDGGKELDDVLQKNEGLKSTNQALVLQNEQYQDEVRYLRNQNDMGTSDKVESLGSLVESQKQEIAGLRLQVENAGSATVTAGSVTTELEQLKKSNMDLQEHLKMALKTLKDCGKHSKLEENKGVMEEIKVWVSKVGFLDVKFATHDALKDFTKKVYAGIKDRINLCDPESDNYLTEDEFLRIYQHYVGNRLSCERQYTQSQCLSAVQGT